MATQLSEEEVNHLRISSLLLKVAPRAVRSLFDSMFPPPGLRNILDTQKPTLENLKKKRIINQKQWDMLYNTKNTTPISSQDFDVTLMVCLIRNLSTIRVQDYLPSKSNTSAGADLSRIKYFRNQIAHSDDGKITTKEFNDSWDELSDAIVRLGGQSYLQECRDLKVANLNQHDKEVLLEIKSHRRELETLNETVKELKDPVPSAVRDNQKLKLEVWKKENEKYIETTAFNFLVDALKQTNIVTVIGNPGTGKSSLIHHIALQLQSGTSEILPVHFPVDILNYCNRENKPVFVIDDVCGKYSVSTQLLESWQMLKEDIENILNTYDIKILLSCRTNIFRSQSFQRLKLFTKNVCDISSRNLKLSREEYCQIAHAYLSETEVEVVKHIVPSMQFDFFPLLCKLYPENRKHNVHDFFTRPITAIEENLRNFQEQEDKTVFCSLALLVVFNNKIDSRWLASMLSDEDKNLLQALCEECEMNCLLSRRSIKRSLDSLLGSYITNTGNSYKALHDKLFDILALHFGVELFDFIFRYANKRFVAERYQFQSVSACTSECAIPVPYDKENDYFERISHELDVAFDNRQLSSIMYRKKFIDFCGLHRERITTLLEQLDDSKTDLQPPIVRVVIHEYGDLVDMLLDFKVNINVADNIGRSLVFIAVENNNTEILSKLLKVKADPNTPDKQGFSPLCVAAGEGKTQTCHMLLSHGADPNKCSLLNMFPLYWATLNEFPEVVKILLDFHANPNLQSSNGWTPLYVACRNGNYEIVKLLINSKAEPNLLLKNYGVSPLFEAVSRGHTNIVRLLLENNAEFKQLLHGRYTLNEAVKMGHKDTAQMLLEYGSNPDGCDCDDEFPILIAVSMGSCDLTKLLISFKANTNNCCRNLFTPLSVASYNGRSDLVLLLLENDANPNFVNENGENALHAAAKNLDSRSIELLLKYKADPNKRNIYGNSCLSEAAFYGHAEAVEILLKFKADPNSCNELNESPVLRGARAGQTKVLEILLKNGADCNILDIDGNSPLSEAACYGHYDIVLVLLENNADPNAPNCYCTTPLHRATESGYTEIVEVLLNYNSNPYVVNEAGLSPKDIAIFCEYNEIFDLLTFREDEDTDIF